MCSAEGPGNVRIAVVLGETTVTTVFEKRGENTEVVDDPVDVASRRVGGVSPFDPDPLA